MTSRQGGLQQLVTVTVWLQVVGSPQASVIDQVSVIIWLGQVPLVTVLSSVIITLVATPVEETYSLLQHEVTMGRSNVHPLLQATILLEGHCTSRHGGLQQLVTVTVWLHVAVLLQPSVINQVCVSSNCGQAPLVTTPVET